MGTSRLIELLWPSGGVVCERVEESRIEVVLKEQTESQSVIVTNTAAGPVFTNNGQNRGNDRRVQVCGSITHTPNEQHSLQQCSHTAEEPLGLWTAHHSGAPRDVINFLSKWGSLRSILGHLSSQSQGPVTRAHLYEFINEQTRGRVTVHLKLADQNSVDELDGKAHIVPAGRPKGTPVNERKFWIAEQSHLDAFLYKCGSLKEIMSHLENIESPVTQRSLFGLITCESHRTVKLNVSAAFKAGVLRQEGPRHERCFSLGCESRRCITTQPRRRRR